MSASPMREYEDDRRGVQWTKPAPSPPQKKFGKRSKSPSPQKTESLIKLKNFKWKMKPKIGELLNQGMGVQAPAYKELSVKSPRSVNFDPKSQKYFNQIRDKQINQGTYKLGYSKDELRENFEKQVKSDYENPYKKGIKIVDKSDFQKPIYQDQLFPKKAKAANIKHYMEPKIAGLIKPSDSPA